MNDLTVTAGEVAEALAAGRPVVALETTLVTHGLPPPDGLATARQLEAAVRQDGAIPATIGVLEGRARVGLSAAELERLARAPDVAKLGLANLAAGIASGRPGSTTVAATMLLAHRAGIGVLATGGIGGVHRDALATGDVSADLTALSRVPVAVVCAGAKAVLDLARTRELLETLGVPVLGFGTDRFPAFYRRDTDLSVDARFDRVPELAAAVRAHFLLGSGTGVVVANPVPAEHELAKDVCETGIAQALADGDRAGVAGRDVTPFLLERLAELTGGRSVATNRALLLGNARLAARLAAALGPAA
jgi:pseudouridine-5'-phosphate glycosidase